MRNHHRLNDNNHENNVKHNHHHHRGHSLDIVVRYQFGFFFFSSSIFSYINPHRNSLPTAAHLSTDACRFEFGCCIPAKAARASMLVSLCG